MLGAGEPALIVDDRTLDGLPIHGIGAASPPAPAQPAIITSDQLNRAAFTELLAKLHLFAAAPAVARIDLQHLAFPAHASVFAHRALLLEAQDLRQLRLERQRAMHIRLLAR